MPGIRKNGVTLYSYKKEKKKDGNKKKRLKSLTASRTLCGSD